MLSLTHCSPDEQPPVLRNDSFGSRQRRPFLLLFCGYPCRQGRCSLQLPKQRCLESTWHSGLLMDIHPVLFRVRADVIGASSKQKGGLVHVGSWRSRPSSEMRHSYGKGLHYSPIFRKTLRANAIFCSPANRFKKGHGRDTKCAWHPQGMLFVPLK